MKKSTTNLSFAIGGVLAGVVVATIAMTLVFGPEFFSLRGMAQTPVEFDEENPASNPSQDTSKRSLENARSLEQVLEIPDEFARKGAFYTYTSQISDDEVLDLVREIKQLDDSYDDQFYLHGAFDKLASVNLRLAISEIRELDTSRKSLLSVMLYKKYVRSDPVIARALMDQLGHEPILISSSSPLESAAELTEEQRRKLLQTVPPGSHFSQETWNEITRLKAMNSEEAWNEIVDQIGNREDSFTIAMNVASPWVRRDGLEALEKIVSSSKNNSVRDNLLNNLADDAFVHGPEALLVFLQDYPARYESPFNAANRVLERWTAADPHAAMAAVLKIDNETSTTNLQVKTLKAWAMHEPEAVWEHLAQVPSHVQHEMRPHVVSRITRESPHAALALVDTLERPQEKGRLLRTVIRQWAHDSPRPAVDWLLSQPREEQVSFILIEAISYLAEKDPREAFDVTQDSRIVFKDEMQLRIVQTTLRTDVERAIEFLPSLSEKNQSRAAAHIGRSMLSYDASRAIQFGKTLDSRFQDPYYQELIHAVGGDDSYRFMRVIDELPSRQHMSLAARVLLRKNEVNTRFSSEEENYLRQKLLPVDEELLNEPKRFIR